MEIRDNRPTMKVEELSNGDCFIYEDEFYIKTDIEASSETDEEVRETVVCELSEGALRAIDPSTDVKYVRADIVVR